MSNNIMSLRSRLKIHNRVLVETDFGVAETVTFRLPQKDEGNLAIIFNRADEKQNPFVRVHSSCFTGEVMLSQRCDCRQQLNEAFWRAAQSEEGGIIIYLKQEGRGIGLNAKLDAYQAQDYLGLNTYEANAHLGLPIDARRYDLAAAMLRALNVSAIRLHTGNPDKVKQLQNAGIKIVEQIPTLIHLNPNNKAYLDAKKLEGAHQFSAGNFICEKV